LLHIFDTRREPTFNPDLRRLEIQTLTNFLCSNKIEILNGAGPRESKEPGVYEWTLAMLHLFFNRTASGADPQKELASKGREERRIGN
jgi:hypothetical protein